MKKLYAPWRNTYTKSAASTKKENATAHECVFCVQLNEHNDAHYFILRRFSHSVVMLNSYPYNTGHLLILPLKHSGQLSDLDVATRTQIMELAAVSTDILTDVLKPHGFNIGINLGKASGASIPSHLHMHVLPRWPSDTNFLPVLADTKIISVDLHETYRQLHAAFEHITL
jgi:ATP adenylyltransferase